MSIQRWDIDGTRSRIQFAVRHLVLSKTRGRFSRWGGSVWVPDGDFTRATLDVVIDASSIDTGVVRRDDHLRSAEYFDVRRYPTITFRGQRVNARPEGRLQVVGALTMRDVTREVALETEPIGRIGPPGVDRGRFSAAAVIDRRDYGFTGNPALDSGGLVIGKLIEVEILLEAVRQPAARVA